MKKAMAALILFLIETLLFYLYEMPLEAWAYSSVFILLIFGGWIILDEVQQRKKYKQLKNIQKEAEVYRNILESRKTLLKKNIRILQRCWEDSGKMPGRKQDVRSVKQIVIT